MNQEDSDGSIQQNLRGRNSRVILLALFMYCSGCGGSIETEAIFCSLCGTRQPGPPTCASRGGAEPPAYALALPQQQIARAAPGYIPTPMPRSYRWGKVHGWLLIFSPVLLTRPHASEKLMVSTLFFVVLGICVLRRNRLILPLMAAWLVIQLFWVLTNPVFLVPERLVLPLILWCLYFVYYYRRKDEFETWL